MSGSSLTQEMGGMLVGDVMFRNNTVKEAYHQHGCTGPSFSVYCSALDEKPTGMSCLPFFFSTVPGMHLDTVSIERIDRPLLVPAWP